MRKEISYNGILARHKHPSLFYHGNKDWLKKNYTMWKEISYNGILPRNKQLSLFWQSNTGKEKINNIDSKGFVVDSVWFGNIRYGISYSGLPPRSKHPSLFYNSNKGKEKNDSNWLQGLGCQERMIWHHNIRNILQWPTS